MTKENKFKIGLCLQEIALSLDDATLERNRDRLKQIEDILIAEEEEQEPCEDVIRRAKAIENIKHAQINFSVASDIDFTKHKREVQEIADGILNAQIKVLSELPSVQPKTRWIPIDADNMPKEGEEILFTVKKDAFNHEPTVLSGWFVSKYQEFEIDDEGRSVKLEDVVAWMPFPEAYKAESEG